MRSETEAADADIETPPLPTAAVSGHRGNFDAQLGLVPVPTLFGFLLSVAAGHGPRESNKTAQLDRVLQLLNYIFVAHDVVHAGEPFRKPCGCSALPTREKTPGGSRIANSFTVIFSRWSVTCQAQNVFAG